MKIRNISPATLNDRLSRGKARVVDVREANEFVRQHIDGAELMPLSDLEPVRLLRSEGAPVVLVCRTGRRSTHAARALLDAGASEAMQLEGGMVAWEAAGLPAVRDRRAPISVMRQVQTTTGSMILLGAILGAIVSPWFHLIAAGAGAGLIVAGLTDNCAMAAFLDSMPWNRRVQRLVTSDLARPAGG